MMLILFVPTGKYPNLKYPKLFLVARSTSQIDSYEIRQVIYFDFVFYDIESLDEEFVSLVVSNTSVYDSCKALNSRDLKETATVLITLRRKL